jgi:hypothetical protein
MALSIAPASRRVSHYSDIVEAEHRRFYEHERPIGRSLCGPRIRERRKISLSFIPAMRPSHGAIGIVSHETRSAFSKSGNRFCVRTRSTF